MMLRATPAALPEILIIEPQVFTDERGFFLESWNQQRFDDAVGRPVRFVQDNQSRSAGGVLRGLHYQVRQPQGKLVRVLAGRVFDVAVDLRRSSPTLGQWVGVELNSDNMRQLWVPPGFGHGFLVLSRFADLLYKTTDYYAPEHERTLRWNDRHVGIDWPLGDVPREPILSAKDAAGPSWDACELFD
jgi:dTDP-4-dehydrorhamnose 3,5-epimerase